MRTLSLNQNRWGAAVLLNVSLERQLLAAACIGEGLSRGKTRAAGWHRGLPNIPSNPKGYEIQCVMAMQRGLMALCWVEPGAAAKAEPARERSVWANLAVSQWGAT